MHFRVKHLSRQGPCLSGDWRRPPLGGKAWMNSFTPSPSSLPEQTRSSFRCTPCWESFALLGPCVHPWTTRAAPLAKLREVPADFVLSPTTLRSLPACGTPQESEMLPCSHRRGAHLWRVAFFAADPPHASFPSFAGFGGRRQGVNPEIPKVVGIPKVVATHGDGVARQWLRPAWRLSFPIAGSRNNSEPDFAC